MGLLQERSFLYRLMFDGSELLPESKCEYLYMKYISTGDMV